jgi:hypothetical protein
MDPISTTANTIAIIDRLAAATAWLLRRFQRKKDPIFPNYYDEQHDIELKPIRIRVDLLNPVPYVELHFYAVNYLKRQLTLMTSGTEVGHVNCGQIIDQIPLAQEYPLAPKSACIVIFRRKLLDSEVRVLAQAQHYNPLSASFSLHAKARYKRKEYVYGPVSSMSIDGWISKR